MKIQCAWCGKDMGDKPPYEDQGTTHTMCGECYRKLGKVDDCPKCNRLGLIENNHLSNFRYCLICGTKFAEDGVKYKIIEEEK